MTADRDHIRFYRHDALALTALCGLILYFFHAPLFDGAALYFRDFQIFFMPMKAWLVEALRQGELPFWNPRIHNGVPFLADIQSGVLYPPSALLLFGGATQGMAVFIAFHLLLAGAGAYLLGRSVGLAAGGALAAALAYTLGGWMASAINMLNMAQTAAWAPLVLWAFERLWAIRSPARLATAAITVALQLLAGQPELTMMTGALVLARLLSLHRQGVLAALLSLAAAYLLAALLAAPQLLATWEAFTLSTRVGGLSAGEILRFSTDWQALASLVFPPKLSAQDWNILTAYPDGEVPLFLSLYLGFGVLTLVALSLVQPRRETFFWLGVAAAGVFFSLGRYNPLAAPLLTLVSIFRSPEKYAFLLHLGAAMLAGFGLRVLEANLVAGQPRWRWIALPLLALVAVELVWVNRNINLIAEPSYYALDDSPEAALLRRQPGPVFSRSEVAGDIERVRALYRAYRDGLAPNLGASVGIDHVDGVFFIVLADHDLQHYFLNSLSPGRELARRLAFFGARYVVAADPAFAASGSWRARAVPLTGRLWMLQEHAPTVYFPATVTTNPAEFVHQAVDTPEYGDGRAAFVPAGEARENLAGQVTRFQRGINGATAEVDTATGGLLVWMQNWYPGWTASIDGAAASVVRANHFFLGVWVPPGRHRVEFAFAPTNWRIGLGLSAAAGLGIAALFVLGGVRRKATWS